MSKLFVRTFASGQVLTADALNEILIRTILKNYNGGLSDYNLKGTTLISGSAILDGSITSRKLILTQGMIRPTANLTLSTSYQDIVGATVTFTPATASTIFVKAWFDFCGIVNSTGLASGALDIDGATQTGIAAMDNNQASSKRLNCAQLWTANLTVASHTIKLQAKKQNAGSGSEAVYASTTSFTYFVISQ